MLVIQLSAASWLQAPQAPEVAEGSRVRVSTQPDVVRPNPLVATLVGMTADSLTVVAASAGSAELSIPNGAVTRLEVSGRRQGRALRGLGIGIVGGATVGLIVGAVFPGERWHPVPLADRGSFPESGHGYTIGLSIGVGSGPR